MNALATFLDRLEENKIWYRLYRYTERESFSVEIALPGEKWEVDFFDNGDIWTEKFKSSGEVLVGEASLEPLFDEVDES